MIYLPFAALLLGFVVSYFTGFTFEVDEVFARYTAIAVLAGLDTVLGGLRAWVSDDDKFDDTIFVSGFFVNALLASGLVVLGEKLGLETGFDNQRVSVMLIAAAVVFGTRIFNNLAALRRLLIEKWRAHGEKPKPGEAVAVEAVGPEAS
jgi:small basic protein